MWLYLADNIIIIVWECIMQIRQIQKLKQAVNIFDLNGIVSQSGKTKRVKYLRDRCYKIGAAINMPFSDVVELTKDNNMQHFRFLESMKNHIIRPQNIVPADDAEYILDIYSKVVKPTAYHFDIVRKTNDSFKTISRIFDLAQDEKSLKFVQIMQYDVLDGSAESAKLITDMLNSPNRDKYIENLNDYISYLKLNTKNEKAIETLDKLLSGNKYNRTKYDNKLSVKNLMKDRSLSTVLEGQTSVIERGFSKEKAELLKLLVRNFVKDKKTANPDTQKVLLDIYNSSDSQNIDLRTSVARRFRYNAKSEEGIDLQELRELFGRIDTDENIRNFVQKVISKDLAVSSVGELNRIINVAPIKKATVFFNNLKRIISTSAGEERTNALKNELENPFYTPAHKIRRNGIYSGNYDYGFVSKMLKIVENEINKFRYRRMLKTQASQMKPQIADMSGYRIKFARPKLAFTDYKIKLSEEVNNKIKNILGEKTYEKQQAIYTENVTAMRLRMLPEIFDAIKAEAHEARKQGKSVTIKNSNALILYKRINGRNRKLIRYMLKQTNENGTKTFSFRDIVKLIDKKETEIANIRQNNPDFKYADTKIVYADLYDELVRKYGKLRKPLQNKTA